MNIYINIRFSLKFDDFMFLTILTLSKIIAMKQNLKKLRHGSSKEKFSKF